MEKKTPSLQLLRKRRFFLLLPLLVLPFTTLLFWALGGGQGSDAVAGQTAAKGGLNMQLPDAYLKDDHSLTKLSYYEMAASDSAKLKEQLRSDPYYRLHKEAASDRVLSGDTMFTLSAGRQNAGGGGLNPSPYSSTYTDPNEAKVYQKLGELNIALSRTSVQPSRAREYSSGEHSARPSVNSADIDRLELMVNRSKSSDNGEDPEMKQLNEVMEKILDIQHPERVKEKKEQSSVENNKKIYAVTANGGAGSSSLLLNNKSTSAGDAFRNNDLSTNGFFALSDDVEADANQSNAIQAVIHETGTVVDGATVKLRLLNDISIKGTLIPKGSFVFGTASLSGERLTIKISSIRYHNSLFPVQLSVFDLDGIEGIHVPGAITKEVANSSADRAVQGIGIASLDPSISAQAARAGIEAAKTLLSRKVKQIKVTLKAGYQVLLYDEREKESF